MMDAQNPDRPGGAPPRTVLLVEDNAIVAMNTEELLLEIGVEIVLTAGSVAEALPLCAEHDIDFALLDLDLGNETSIPIAAVLRQADIAFVFASGYGDNIQLPSELSGTTVLRKPYLLADLEGIVLGVPG